MHIIPKFFRELLSNMIDDSKKIQSGSRVQAIAKYLERIGDHATNLAEFVIFMVKGKDIRNLGKLEKNGDKKVPHGVLFLCVHNSIRSQMAEGWAKKLWPSSVRIWSAGSKPAEMVNPIAIKVMDEVNIDISNQRPKQITDVPLGDIDTIIILCAEEICVTFPGQVHRESWVLPDPGMTIGTEDEILNSFRDIRDKLKKHVEEFL